MAMALGRPESTLPVHCYPRVLALAVFARGHYAVVLLVLSSLAVGAIPAAEPEPSGSVCAAAALEEGAGDQAVPLPHAAGADSDDLAVVQLQSYPRPVVQPKRVVRPDALTDVNRLKGNPLSLREARSDDTSSRTFESEDPIANSRPGRGVGSFVPMWSEMAVARTVAAAAAASQTALLDPQGDPQHAYKADKADKADKGTPPVQFVSTGRRVESSAQEVARLRQQNAHLLRELELMKRHPTFGPGLLSMWRSSKAACIAALAILGSFALFFLLAFCYFHLRVRRGHRAATATASASATAAPPDSSQPQHASQPAGPGFGRPKRLQSGVHMPMHLRQHKAEEHPDEGEGWFEAQCPRLCLPFRVLIRSLGLPGHLARLCCSLSPETAMGFLLVLSLWCGGLCVLWHHGYVQPVLGTMLVYLYFVFFFIILIGLVLTALWARFHGKINAGLDLARRMQALHEHTSGQHLGQHLGGPRSAAPAAADAEAEAEGLKG